MSVSPGLPRCEHDALLLLLCIRTIAENVRATITKGTSGSGREQREHVWSAAIRADRGKRRKSQRTNCAASRLLASIDDNNGIAVTAHGDPKPITNSSFEQQLSETQRGQLRNRPQCP